MRRELKPIRVFFSELSRCFYATRAYTIDDSGLVFVTGQKFDVTNDIATLIEQHNVIFQKREATQVPHSSAVGKLQTEPK